MKLETNVNGQKVTIELTQEQLVEIHKQTSNFSLRLDYEQITSVKLACEVTGDDYGKLMAACRDLPNDEAAFKQLKVVRKAINPIGYKPNWNDTNEYKYLPYFKLSEGFSYWSTHLYATYSSVPSALFSIDSNRAEHFGETFIDLFKDLLTEE